MNICRMLMSLPKIWSDDKIDLAPSELCGEAGRALRAEIASDEAYQKREELFIMHWRIVLKKLYFFIKEVLPSSSTMEKGLTTNKWIELEPTLRKNAKLTETQRMYLTKIRLTLSVAIILNSIFVFVAIAVMAPVCSNYTPFFLN